MRIPGPAARRVLLTAVGVALVAARPAAASDEKAFLELKAKYEKAAKNHDDKGIRERRVMITGSFFDYLDLKPCRKMLHDVFDADDSVDVRVACVQVLGASGDPKDLDAIVKGLAKDKVRGPTIAVGEGLAYTVKDAVAAAALHAAEAAAKAKGDARVALLEGVAELGDAGAFDAVAAVPVNDKTSADERYMRDVAMGACGKEKAMALLAPDLRSPDPVVRLGAATGLAKSAAKEAYAPLVAALKDGDPRVVETAAKALGDAKMESAKTALVDALVLAPLRVKWTIRAALAAIVGKDYGLDPANWRAALDGKTPAVVAADQPASPLFFGVPVASDRVVVVLDASRRMTYNDRFSAARQGVESYLTALDATTQFDVYSPVKGIEKFQPALASGAASKEQAIAWTKALATGRGFDLKAGLDKVLEEQPDVDTIVLATASTPAGLNANDTPMEVLETFRRANLTRRIRVDVAFVAPGGRLPTSETEDEFEDRAFLLQQLAEKSGGKFVRTDK